jgi:plasmid stability protein
MHVVNASHLTVRNLIDLLRQSLGVKGARSNGVGSRSGTWTESEHREFLSAIRSFEEIDQDLWK